MSEKAAISAREIALMENSHAGHYGALALVVLMHAVMAWGQSNDVATADAALHAEMLIAIKDMSAGCSRFVESENRYKEDVIEQRRSTNGVVAEDMRCRQCRGKCRAEDLRCRSQCAGEAACLAHCEDRSSKCETMRKQIFQCE